MSDEDLDTEIIECWCGAKGTFDELFDKEVLSESCGGYGEIQCCCGGDQCVCHWHGAMQCDGCEDCNDDEFGDDDDDYEDDWEDDIDDDFVPSENELMSKDETE